MARRSGGGFLRGAVILTAGMVFVKAAGALFKIPLKYAIGEYGMGLFNVAYSFYGPVFSLATAGFPAAVSRLTAESRGLGRWNDARQVRRVAFPLFLAFGGVGALSLTLLAGPYCYRVIDTPYALAPVLALAPAILFACAGAVYRGAAEGLGDMAPTAASQVAEAAVKLGLGLALARWVVAAGTKEYAQRGTVFSLAPAGPEEARLLTLSLAAAGAVLGVTAGSLAALLLLAAWDRLAHRIDPRRLAASPPARGRRETARRLLRVTAPIAVGSVTANAAGLIDATALQGRLAALLARDPDRLLAQLGGAVPELYLSQPETIPTFLYGCYTLAMAVYLLVPSLTQAIGVSALPAVAAAWAGGDRRLCWDRIAAVCRVTALVCFPAGLGIAALAGPIVRVLYGGGGSAALTARALGVLGAASLAAALCGPLSSVLQAVGRADLPVKLLAGAMAVKVGVTWVLSGVPEIHLLGAAWGTLVSYLALAAAELLALAKVTGAPLPPGRLFGRPLACAALCGAAAWAGYQGASRALPEAPALAAGIACGALCYGLGLVFVGGIEKSDLKMLPGGEKIAKTLEKWE